MSRPFCPCWKAAVAVEAPKGSGTGPWPMAIVASRPRAWVLGPTIESFEIQQKRMESHWVRVSLGGETD